MKKCLLFCIAITLSLNLFAQNYQIDAHLTGFKNGTKFYLNDTQTSTNIDSAIIKNNTFGMKGRLDNTPQNLWVTAAVGNEFYFFTLLIGNDHITVNGDVKDFPYDLSIKGSKIQDVHNQYINIIKESFKERNRLVEHIRGLKGDSAAIKSQAIWAIISKLDQKRNQESDQFVKTHLNSYEGLFNLFYMKDRLPRDSMQLLYNRINPTFKKTAFAKQVATYLKVGNILEQGDQATNFKAFDAEGEEHSLFDYKGKYVLLDFSSTYCGPCIESLDELHRVADKFKDKLSVITISGDAGKALWLTGYKRDKPSWLSLWDGKGYYSEIGIKYGVSGYPTFVLINADGKIESIWSGYGKPAGGPGAIESKIDKLLAKK